MSDEVGGVRDHLANERTQLAWMRTGANVMVVGLAVARFADDGEMTGASLAAGGLLIVAGAVAIAYGTVRYRRVAEELQRGTASSAAASGGPAIAGIVLIVATVVATAILLLAA